jgi:hypothetical protein
MVGGLMDWKDIELTDEQLIELKETGKVTLTRDQQRQLGFEAFDFDKYLKLRRELWETYTRRKSD